VRAALAAALMVFGSLGDPKLALAQSATFAAERGTRDAQTPAQRFAESTVDVAIAGGVAGRRFEYENGIDPSANRYTLRAAPAASLRGQLFPLARAGAPWADLGIVGEYTRISSEMNSSSSAAADTFPSSCSAGVRARIHPGSSSGLIVGVSMQYTFTSLRSVGPPPFELPDVTYRTVRPAIDSRVSAGRFALLAEVGFRSLVYKDAISTRFYSPQGYGLDAELGASLLLHRAVEARLAVEYEVYSLAFAPPIGATFAAGGVRDQLYGARLGIAFVL
jgi:hypothetical protein